MSGGKSGGGEATLKDYYASFAGIAGWGPAHALVALIVDGKEVWRPGSPVLESVSSNPYTFDVTGYGRVHFYWGKSDQTLTDPVLTTYGDHPPYRRRCLVVFEDFLCGRERESVPDMQVIYWRKPQQTLITGSAADLDAQGQCNPLCAIVERITDPVRGLGKSNSFFNATAWQSLADALYADAANQYLSLDLMTAGSVRNLVEEINGYLDTYFRADDDGLLEVGQFLDGLSFPTGLDTLSEHDLEKGGAIDVDPQPMALNTSLLELKFTDRAKKFEEDSARYENQALQDLTGSDKADTLERPWIRRGGQANKKVAELGAKEARPYSKVSASFRPEQVSALKPGDLVTIDKGSTSWSQICRILTKEADADGGSETRLQLETERMLAPVPGDFDEDELPTESAVPLADINWWHVLQAPNLLADGHYHLTALVGQDHGSWRGAKIYFQDGAAEYDFLGVQSGFAVPLVLHDAYADTEALDDTSGNLLVELPDPAALGFDQLETAPTEDQVTNDEWLVFIIDQTDSQRYEVLTLKSIEAPTAGVYPLHVLRARFGTERLSFVADDYAYIIRRRNLEFWTRTDLQDQAHEALTADREINHKVVPYRQDEELDLSAATAKTLELDPGIPDVPTGLTLTPGILSIQVDWDDPPEAQRSRMFVTYATDAGFTTPTVRDVHWKGPYVLNGLDPTKIYYVKISAVDWEGDQGDYSSALSYYPYNEFGVPDFSAYGKIGGNAQIRMRFYKDENNLSDANKHRIQGRLWHPTDGEYVLPEDNVIESYMWNLASTVYLAYLPGATSMEDLYGAVAYPNPTGENKIMPLQRLGTGWRVLIGDSLDVYNAPTGLDLLLFGKVTRADNAETYFIPLGDTIPQLEFKTLAELKTYDYTDIPAMTPIRTVGRDSADDGLPIKAYYDPAATGTENDATVFTPATGGGRVKRVITGEINILDAGAKTTPGFDNTNIINSCLSLSRRVFVPDGTFEYSGKIDVSDERTLYGVSHGNSVLKANHADAHVSVASNSHFSKIRIDGDDTAEFGLICAFGSGAYVEHIRILGHTEAGLCLDGCQNSTFISLKISNNKRNLVLANDARNNWFLGIQTRWSSPGIASHADNRHIWAGVWAHAKLASPPPYGGQTIMRNMFLGGVFEGEHGNDYAVEFFDGGLAGHSMAFYQTEITSYPNVTALVKVGADFDTAVHFNDCKLEGSYAFDIGAGQTVKANACNYTGGGEEGKYLGDGKLILGVDQTDVGFNMLGYRDSMDDSIYKYGIGNWIVSGTATLAHNATTEVMDVTSPSTTGNSGAKVLPSRLPTIIASYSARVVELKVWIENNLAQRQITGMDAGTDLLTMDTTDWNVIADFSVGDEVIYVAGDSDIGGLTDQQTYYVAYRDATTIKLESTVGGGAIDLTGTLPSGTHYIKFAHPPILLRWITFNDPNFSTRNIGYMLDGLNTFADRLQGDEVGLEMISQKVGGQSWSVGMIKPVIH